MPHPKIGFNQRTDAIWIHLGSWIPGFPGLKICSLWQWLSLDPSNEERIWKLTLQLGKWSQTWSAASQLWCPFLSDLFLAKILICIDYTGHFMATNDISTLLSQIESLISLSQCPQNRFLTYPPVISPVLPFRHRKFHHLGILFVRTPWFFMSELRRRSGWQQCPIVSRTRPWESAKPWLSASDIELSDSFFPTYIHMS